MRPTERATAAAPASRWRKSPSPSDQFRAYARNLGVARVPTREHRLIMRAMSRPLSPRSVSSRPVAPLFKPGGVPAVSQIRLGLDEFEALRLADVERLQQADAAPRMGISRQTFGRVLASARRKVAEALVFGHALRIDAPPGPRPAARNPRCGHRCAAKATDCATCSQHLVQLRGGRPRAPKTSHA